MSLYVMRTFLAFLHIGKVECVTDQVPSSHSRGGEVKAVDEGSLGLYFFGERREIDVSEERCKGGAAEAATAGVSTVMVVPPGDSPGKTLEVVVDASIILSLSRYCNLLRTINSR